ncbi:MAG: hypothetical protein LBH69_03415 [Methanomassiliicoccaceae archaeon]|jgi:TRAP-type C4-dicarboxylate transport system permease small subunit|nr:hypothetical protein [Methanomassiliicoccaceae archaeon]
MTLIDDIRYDLSPKNGWLTGAGIYFFAVLAVFVIVPYLVYSFAADGLASTDVTLFGAADLRNGAWLWVSDMMKYAIPLLLLAIPIGFYRAGSYARIPFKIIFAVYLGSWLWVASHGGVFSATVDGIEISGITSSLTLGLDVRYVVYVTLMICFAMMFLAVSEFGGNRQKYFEYLEKKKDTMSRRKARRLSGKG